ncbi:glycosyl hydrolase family 71-domain-containing protein [Microdochium trichocladiopsis]|uniref:Glycosyl hydrolase family 71-domain-containing protein n=1 Tax=Microdochium trichocladiopsis TaxID=1682393 RepID=A0A9P9BJ39_9PEZI|nr:glycosyl hydrolase family 71-domain-containing protein [Microdochium trichocladiopsis]KAH7016391.1 glycosyl hydrolase family 71-domain-containing protein [Microdochium trichocladiopsis]
MGQGLNIDSAVSDVAKAVAMGIDAFALNVGQPDPDWSVDCVKRFFNAAQGTKLKIFFSLDLYATNDPERFRKMINDYLGHPNYYTVGPNNLPMLSHFSNGNGWTATSWNNFRESLKERTYFVPMFDQFPNYYTKPDAFWSSWSVPSAASSHLDASLMRRAYREGKAYMTGLSTFQYKHYKNDHWYRVGDTVMPEKMTQLLALSNTAGNRPDFIQIQSWNDAGEGHYIGHLRHESLLKEQLAYANQDEHPHDGWQPLFTSFINAWKSNAKDASQMQTPAGSRTFVVGAMWHREFLASSSCSGTDGKPLGGRAAWWQPHLQGEAAAGSQLPLCPVVKTGEQHVQVVDAAGVPIIESGKKTKGIAANPKGDLCTYNYRVAWLV